MKRTIKISIIIVINVIILIPSVFIVIALGIPTKPVTSWKYGYGSIPDSIAISSDGTYLAVGSRGEILLFKQTEKELLWRFQSGNEAFYVDISSDGYYIAACGVNGDVHLFNRSSPIPIWTNSTGLGLLSVAISKDGNYIAAANYPEQGRIFFFNKASSSPIWVHVNPSTEDIGFSDVAISDNGSYILASSLNGNISLFNNFDSNPLWTYKPGFSLNNPNVALSSNGRYLAINGDSFVLSFNNSTPIPYWVYNIGHSEFHFGHQNIQITSDGQKIYAAGDQIYMFNTTNSISPLIQSKSFGYEVITAIDISLDGQYMAVKGSGAVSIYRDFSKIWQRELYPDSTIVMSDNGQFISFGTIQNIYFVDRTFPEFIDDFNQRLTIGIIVIAVSFGIEAISIVPLTRYYKKWKSKRIKIQREKFQKLMDVSNKIRIDMLRNVLKLSKKEINERIQRWQSEFGIVTEDEFIIFNKDEMPAILDLLDESYKEWTDLEEKKEK